MEIEEFESELGNVAVTRSHVEREEREGDWDDILEEYDSLDLVDRVHFSEIENVDCMLGAEHPAVMIKTGEGWKKMFFEDGETAESCYNFLRYRWQAFRQIHGT